MTTLHIEHAVVDFDLWRQAFNRMDEARARAGVRSVLIRQPFDDPHFVVIDLDFATTLEAQQFLGFLRNKVWSSAEAAPALVGAPETKILELVATR
jgi:hypothetical protein